MILKVFFITGFMKKNVRILVDGFHFLRTITPRKIVNLLLIYTGLVLSDLFKKPVVPGMPHTLSVEPGTLCNLSCPECPIGNHTLKRKSGTMNEMMFKQIIDQTAAYLNHLMLYFQGEPFLTPWIFDFIKYARKKNIYVSTSTNGHYLDRKAISGILESGLDRLIISLDGATAETYRQYRVGGNFDSVVRGIRDLIRERKAGGYTRPYIIIQFIYFRHNLQEKEQIKKLVKSLEADRLEYKTAQFYNLEKTNAMIPPDEKYARYILKNGKYVLKYKLKNRCPRLWNTTVITWDGKVVPCCFDKDAEYIMGEIPGTSFRKIWKSEKYNNFRHLILMQRHEVELCRNCTEALGKKL